MRTSRSASMHIARAAALVACIVLVPATPARAGVSTALSPAHVVVQPDSAFTLDLDVTAAGSPFNGFTAVVSYDPAVLVFVPATPASLQQGCLMTGTCSSACGGTFHRFNAAGDSLVSNVSLLCDSIALTGPGQIYTLKFRAAHVPNQTTFVRVRRILFVNAGLYVTPVTSADTQVDILRTTAVAPGATAGGLRLDVQPNPARGTLSLAIAAGEAAEQAVDVLDLAGRLVRHLDRAWYAPGTRLLRWDGAGADGLRLPSGVYLVRVRAGERTALSRVVLLR